MKYIYILWVGFFGHPEVKSPVRGSSIPPMVGVKLCLLILLYAEMNYKIYNNIIYIYIKSIRGFCYIYFIIIYIPEGDIYHIKKIIIYYITILYIWVNQQETIYKYISYINIKYRYICKYIGSLEIIRNSTLFSNKLTLNKYDGYRKDYLSINNPLQSRDLCYNISRRYLHINNISINVPFKYKPLNKDQLGYYLAGLIDGDGNFSNQKGYLTIVYDIKDKSAAYWLKDQIGYGTISLIKNKNAIKYVVSHSDGLLYILELINGKLKTNNKYNQVVNYLLLNNNQVKSKFYFKYDKFKLGNINDFYNHWLSGFIDADGSLQIKIINRKNRNKEEVRLKLQITQRDKHILENIKLFLSINKISKDMNISYDKLTNLNKNELLSGCYIGTRKHMTPQPHYMEKVNKTRREVDQPGEAKYNITYYFETTSFNTFKNVINYLDKYPLISYKYLNYLYIRKAYLLIQNKEHLTLEGINKIKNIKNKMSPSYGGGGYIS